MRVLSTPTEIR
jgi:hypothetical protein